MQRISPFLWFDNDQAEEAARFYVETFPNSHVIDVIRAPGDGAGARGGVMGVLFSLDGIEMEAFNGGPGFPFTEAISLFVNAETQDEIDRLWDALTEGGEPSRCGWLKDRFGVSWQIVPPVLTALLSDPDPGRSGRAMQAMLGMTKLDIAELRAAADRVEE